MLKNVPGIREAVVRCRVRGREHEPTRRRPVADWQEDPSALSSDHHHVFRDVYASAGKFRTVRLSREGSVFCYPENIERMMHSH